MTESINSKPYTFNLPHGHYNAFAQLAKDLGLNRSELLRRLIDGIHAGDFKAELRDVPYRLSGRLTVERTVAAEPTVNAASVWAPGHGPATYAGGGFGPQPDAELQAAAKAFGAMAERPPAAAFPGIDGKPIEKLPPGQTTPPLPADNWFAQRLASGNAPKAVLEEFDPSKPSADGQ